MNYTTSCAKCRFGCHGWCQNTQKTSYYSCKNRIFFTIIFSPTLNIKIYYLIRLKNSLFHTDIISKHLTFGYWIRYGSDIVFTISVFAPNLRIWIQILTNVKKWYPYSGQGRIRMRIFAKNPHLMALLTEVNCSRYVVDW